VEVLEAKVVLPRYLAVIESAHAGSEETRIEVIPPANVPVPTTVDPLRRFTVPVGVPELDVTVAVKVTASP